ncbi:MAG: acyltransferase [Myxococcota bacterium]|nr:acyltransferase [Myxococcota bacterium]
MKTFSLLRSGVYYLIARCFYAKVYCRSRRVPLRTLIAYGFMQRVIGFNRHVPWPVHCSSTVSRWEKISQASLFPWPGYLPGQYIQAKNGIAIGSNVRLGPGVKIVSADHSLNDYNAHKDGAPIVIGDNCWLAANVVILSEVTLGEHVAVAAGAVVNQSFGDNLLIGGIPARQLRSLDAYGLDAEKALD